MGWMGFAGGFRGFLLRLVYQLTRSVGGDGRWRTEARLRTLLERGVRAIGPYPTVEFGADFAMEFAWIPPGQFLMGSTEDEGAPDEETPRHEVTLTRGCWMGTTPVTRVQFAAIMGKDSCFAPYISANGNDGDHPSQEVEFGEAVAFLERLTERAGEGTKGPRFRLPTEAEWEYACRAGTTTLFRCGDGEAELDKAAWYGENGFGVRPVGTKAGNPLGLHDMHGNVREWCVDGYDEITNGRLHPQRHRFPRRCRRTVKKAG